ncbi:MAG: efflux RND transporter permease subunit [Crocinitomicaceae bacterium]|nr:efflux RND transporter permease subunit [Crocinitomicaceae bacterium]
MVGESFFKKYIWYALIAFVGLTTFFVYNIFSVEVDYDFEKFFPLDDPDTDFFFEYRSRFESDNDFLLLAIENDGGAFEQSFLKSVSKLEEKLSKVDDIKVVRGITSMSEFISGQGPIKIVSEVPYIDFDNFDRKRDSTRVFKNVELVNSFVAKDGLSLCLFIRHTDFISKKKSDKLIVEIEKALKPFDFDNYRLAGRTVGQKYYIEKMSFEMALFIGLSSFLIVLFLFLAFRSAWGIIIPQIVIVSSMLWVVGGMGVANEPINIILTILPSIMFVVSMSDVIHLVSRYLDALREEDSIFNAIMVAVKEVGMATFLTSITTAVGFFSLYFVQVQPIQIFGLIMGIGVIVAFILTFLMLPILFYIFPGPIHVREKKKDHFWKKYLRRWFILVIRKRKIIFILSGVVVAFSLFGISRIEANNFLMDDMKPTEPMKMDFNYLDEHYGGVRPFQLAIKIKDTSINVWDKSVLKQVDSIERYLQEDYGVQIQTSLVSLLKVANRSDHLGNIEYYKLPTKTRKIRSFRKALRMAGKGKFIGTFIDSNEMFMRISGSIPDWGNNKVSKKNDALKELLRKKEKSGLAEYKITGTAELIDKNMSYLASSLVKGLAVSILIVAIIIGLIYRSFRMLLISIVPNLLPLIVIAGFMGYVGLELKTVTSIIFTIAFGIAVDDTIHFLGKFKYELGKGKGKLYALKTSYMTTGKAMILTTLILCAGFLLLIFSSFLGTFYMGLLLCLTLFVALLADLTLLPVLLLVFFKDNRQMQKQKNITIKRLNH